MDFYFDRDERNEEEIYVQFDPKVIKETRRAQHFVEPGGNEFIPAEKRVEGDEYGVEPKTS